MVAILQEFGNFCPSVWRKEEEREKEEGKRNEMSLERMGFVISHFKDEGNDRNAFSLGALQRINSKGIFEKLKE